MITTCHIFVFNDFEYVGIVATCRQRYTCIASNLTAR